MDSELRSRKYHEVVANCPECKHLIVIKRMRSRIKIESLEGRTIECPHCPQINHFTVKDGKLV